ncbi:MAG: methyltransferase domain-containing protein [Proteobacteria bacterium]|nr:methyltransferase domain-containing protein [Pseudomonadota bacterium]
MITNDPYGSLKHTLPLLDLMHRHLLPGVSRDLTAIMKDRGIKKVLDVACGTGFIACRLQKKGINTVGVDLSPGMISVAAKKAGDCAFVLGDGRRLPFSRHSFDGAVITLALHEVDGGTRDAVWSEMKRVVRPEGLLFALDFARMPARRTVYSRLVAWFIMAIEKATLKFDPDHWHNSMAFQGLGGILGWLSKNGGEIATARDYAGGNLVLAVLKNPE